MRSVKDGASADDLVVIKSPEKLAYYTGLEVLVPSFAESPGDYSGSHVDQ